MLARQRLQRRQRVAHDDDASGSVRTRLHSHRGIIHDGARRTGRERRGGETVAVEAFAVQGEKDRPLPRPPRIGRDGRITLEKRVQALGFESSDFVHIRYTPRPC